MAFRVALHSEAGRGDENITVASYVAFLQLLLCLFNAFREAK